MLSLGLPPEIYGGAEQQCLRLSKALQAQGQDIVIVASSRSPGLPRQDVIDGVPVVRITTRHGPDYGGRHVLSSMTWTARVLMWLFRHRREISLVHVHQGKFHMLPALLAQALFGIPFVIKVGSSDEQFDYLRLTKKRGGYGRLVLRSAIKRCRAHIALSSKIAEQMRAVGVPADRIRQIPNGIDIARFPFDVAGRLGDARVFAFFGRLEPEKQPMMMLRCFANALRTGDPHRLVIAGDGSLLDEMRRFVSDRGLENHIVFLGRIDDVGPVVSQAHYFVLPSKIEGFSNALLEAMSGGLVAIASAVSGSTDAIRHGWNGFLFDRDDEAAFSACLREAIGLSETDWQVMRRAARDTIEDTYVMENIAKTYVTMYLSLGDPASEPGST